MNPPEMPRKRATKTKILQTALKLLETQGIEQVTVRKIAAQAGVNIAAVNYHFGSKEQVIFSALQTLRDSFGEAFEYLRSSALPPRERLVAFMTTYCDTVFTYPTLVKAFINQNLNAEIQQDYSSFVRAEGLALITQTLGEILPLDDETLRMKAFQMMSNLVLILLVGQNTAAVIGLDFADPQVRARYIQSIVPGA